MDESALPRNIKVGVYWDLPLCSFSSVHFGASGFLRQRQKRQKNDAVAG